MTLEEMVDMVEVLEKKDYDGKCGPYTNTNARKDRIMDKIVRVLQRNHGVHRSKDQLRKRWSDLKLREEEQYHKIRRIIKKSKHAFPSILHCFTICAILY